MRITLAAMGKMKPSPERDLLTLYQKRLPWPLTVHELEAKPSLPMEKRREAEGELLLAKCAGAHRLIALDERGESLRSDAFAVRIGQWQTQGDSHIAFIIGGADGLSDAVRRRADLLLSFGAQTWPHLLVRALLAEQLYRAYTILSGHPYHRA